MQRRTVIASAAAALIAPRAFAHHGWSSFDQERPIYLEGKAAKVAWRNPHVEVELQLGEGLKLPADLAQRSLPAQSASVDGARLLAAARLPTRRDAVWQIEFAPLTRMDAWKVPEIKVGDVIAVLGFTFAGEKGDAVLRAEYLFAGGKTYGMRSSPA
jgi:Family of unknown function (DUF6152)